MTNESPTPEIGDLADQTLGEFKLLRRLGRGGMAEVYLAEQTSLSRFVAVKVLLREMVDEADGVPLKRFEQEARTAGSINHPNIVQVYTIGEEDGLHYIVQEFVEGLNLSEHIKRNGPPDVVRGLDLMEQIAKAMKVASEAGIVHRDIKPENIMVTRDGTAKVADFGLAQLSQKQEALNLTQQGTTMGTPLYMSPEQINGEKLDNRSDLYSVWRPVLLLICRTSSVPGRDRNGGRRSASKGRSRTTQRTASGPAAIDLRYREADDAEGTRRTVPVSQRATCRDLEGARRSVGWTRSVVVRDGNASLQTRSSGDEVRASAICCRVRFDLSVRRVVFRWNWVRDAAHRPT